mmetsp:Transcript_53941/g.172965  ORF Transcript_53941/g.172965 Transcript_53941/m.172965 type:complete len:221 (+) Transcript_53941:72-734(+)
MACPQHAQNPEMLRPPPHVPLLLAGKLQQLLLRVEAHGAAERDWKIVLARGGVRVPPEQALEVGLVALDGGAHDVQCPRAAVRREALAVPPPLEVEGQLVRDEVQEDVAERLLVPGAVGEVEQVVGAVSGPLTHQHLLVVARRDVAHGQRRHARLEGPEGPLRAEGAPRRRRRGLLRPRRLLLVLRGAVAALLEALGPAAAAAAAGAVGGGSQCSSRPAT